MAHAALNSALPPAGGQRRTLAELGIGAAWMVGTSAAIGAVDIALAKTPLAAALAAALVTDFAAGFAGVRWDSKSHQKSIPFNEIGFGAAASLGIFAVTLGLSAAFGWISAEKGSPAPALLLALLRAAAMAVRNELLFRGITFATAARTGLPNSIALAFGAFAGGASMAFASSFGPAAIALSMASGFFFGVLWLRFQSAWAALSAHTLFLFLIGPGLRGGLLDIGWSSGALAPNHRSFGGAAWLCASVFTAAAIVLLKRMKPPSK